MIKLLFNQKYKFTSQHTLDAFRYKMLRRLLYVAFIVPFTFGVLDFFEIVRVRMGLPLAIAELAMGVSALIMLLILNRYKKSYRYILYGLGILSFVLFVYSFSIMQQDHFRMAWFIVLIVGGFILHDIRFGLFLSVLTLGFLGFSFTFTSTNLNAPTMLTALVSIFIVSGLMYFYTKRVKAYEEELLQKNRALDKLATTDTLTGLSNRRKFLKQSTKMLIDAQKEGSFVFFIMIDIDHFKKINDTQGHKAGDDVLVRFSEVVQEILPKQALFGRLGGEEFAVIYYGSIEDVMTLAHSICKEVKSRVDVTVSIGISQSSSTSTIDTIMHEADMLMYRAKEEGRDRVVVAW